ncbi:transglycosylase domain-containing protein [Pseudomonas putida]|nr:transglycosylase domain-containing protein [Pseudomonas putida]
MLNDFSRACEVVDGLRGRYPDLISSSLVGALVVAEDHRNCLHYGVDPLAIMRAFKVRMFERKRQGASTIEQQLVRTITARYEKTPRRKIREQLIAVMLSFKYDKADLARVYLQVAYYGVSLVGVRGLQKLQALAPIDADAVIVAHLKYPRVKGYDGVMAKKHYARVRHVNALISDRRSIEFQRVSSRASLVQAFVDFH